MRGSGGTIPLGGGGGGGYVAQGLVHIWPPQILYSGAAVT